MIAGVYGHVFRVAMLGALHARLGPQPLLPAARLAEFFLFSCNFFCLLGTFGLGTFGVSLDEIIFMSPCLKPQYRGIRAGKNPNP